MDMTTTRRTAKAAEPADPATTEAPGTAPDAAPGPQQAPEGHEPALDKAAAAEAEPYDFTAHARRVLGVTWPSPDAPVVLTAKARAAWRDAADSTARAADAALAEVEATYQAAWRRVHEPLNAWLQMRSQRFPQHAA